MINEKTFTLLVSRSQKNLESLERILIDQPGIRLQVKNPVNGHFDPLHGVNQKPDVLVLDLSDAWEEELKALSIRPRTDRPPVIVFGPEGNTSMMRLAMQAGAQDFFTHPVLPEEIIVSVKQIGKESTTKSNKAKTALTAVINAKGGSGASFIACNLAHIMAIRQHRAVTLIDMDLQFGTLPLYLDLEPNDNLTEVLRNINELDEVAIQAQMMKHSSGLHLLASSNENMLPLAEISAQRINRLLDLKMSGYEHLVVDLPRQIDLPTTTILQRADHVLLVMQQSVSHIRDAKRMHRIMTTDLAIPNNHISIIVNRYNEKDAVRVEDIKNSVTDVNFLFVPSDFKRASEMVNMGIPLFDNAPKAGITKSLIGIAEKLDGQSNRKKQGFLQNTFSNIFSL